MEQGQGTPGPEGSTLHSTGYVREFWKATAPSRHCDTDFRAHIRALMRSLQRIRAKAANGPRLFRLNSNPELTENDPAGKGCNRVRNTHPSVQRLKFILGDVHGVRCESSLLPTVCKALGKF